MISVYVREQQHYSGNEICALLRCEYDKGIVIIRRMMSHGILKPVRGKTETDLSELLNVDEEEPFPNDAKYFVFSFVGVAVVCDCVIKSYPKYIRSSETHAEQLKTVLKVIEKHGGRQQHIKQMNDVQSAGNMISVRLFLIRSFLENGLYSSNRTIIEENGTGSVLWEETIRSTFPLISGGKPFYVTLKTEKKSVDEQNYMRRLHAAVITVISREFDDAEISSLFGLPSIRISEEAVSFFGDAHYILHRIENELHAQYDLRKQQVLKALYAYIKSDRQFGGENSILLYGTKSFNLIWQDVCAEVFGDMLHVRLKNLPVSKTQELEYDPDLELADIVAHPVWTAASSAEESLEPDIICMEGKTLTILDAKYYTPVFERSRPPRMQPGVESVIKQYMYQKAYCKFAEDFGFSEIKNAFIFPTEKNSVEKGGAVFLELFREDGLEDILVCFAPAEVIYRAFLNDEKLPLSFLEL